jgi:DNA-binding CsgD family transcriptional regulator
MNDGQMHETIRSLYQGVFETGAWQRSLVALCGASGSSQASLIVRNRALDRVVVTHAVDYKPDAMEAYTSHYYQFDPSRPFAERLGVGDWYIDHRDVGEQVMRASPFYGEFLRDLNIASVMSCLIERHPTYEIYLSLQRPLDANVYAEADALALDWVIPHLRDALGLRERMQELATRGRLSEDMLNRLPFGVVVFDLTGKPLFANQSGEPWVRRLMPAAFFGPRASAPTDSAFWQFSRPFPEVLRAVAAPDTLQAAQAIQAAGPDGRTAQIVTLALAPMAQSLPGMETHTVLAAIHERYGTPRAMPAILRDLFGLTPAETRLAALLTQGVGLPDACAQLGIKRETSRTQVKSIFNKTRTSTQAQLAHLLTRLSTMLTEPSRY